MRLAIVAVLLFAGLAVANRDMRPREGRPKMGLMMGHRPQSEGRKKLDFGGRRKERRVGMPAMTAQHKGMMHPQHEGPMERRRSMMVHKKPEGRMQLAFGRQGLEHMKPHGDRKVLPQQFPTFARFGQHMNPQRDARTKPERSMKPYRREGRKQRDFRPRHISAHNRKERRGKW